MPPGWLIGPVAATAALVVLGFVWLGLYASGGGLLIAAAAALVVGVSAALAAPRHRGRNAAITAAYVVALLAAYLIALQSVPVRPGASQGGPTVPRPQDGSVGVRGDFGHLAEGLTAPRRGEPIQAGYRMFSAPDVADRCRQANATRTSRLEATVPRVELRVGAPFPLQQLSLVAINGDGLVLPVVPIAIESEIGSRILDTRADRIAEGAVTPLRAGTVLLRVRTVCEGPGAELFIVATVSAVP
jgi:hypothetical protein